VRRAADVAVGALLVEQRRVLERLLVELRDGVEAGAALVQRRDPRDVRAGELDGRELAVLHHLDGRRAVESLEVEHGVRMGGRSGDQQSGERAQKRDPPGRRGKLHVY
jgi:hypothetical protein